MSKKKADTAGSPTIGSPTIPVVSETPHYDALSDRERLWVDHLFTCGLNQTEASRRMGYKAPEKHGWRMSKEEAVQRAIEERLQRAGASADLVAFILAEHLQGTAADWVSFEEVEVYPKVRIPLAEHIEQLREDIRFEEDFARRAGLEGDEMERHESDVAARRRRILRLEMELERDPDRTVRVEGEPEVVERARIDLVKLRDAGKLHLVKSAKQDDKSIEVKMYDVQAAADKILKMHGAYGDGGVSVNVNVQNNQSVFRHFATPDIGTDD